MRSKDINGLTLTATFTFSDSSSAIFSPSKTNSNQSPMQSRTIYLRSIEILVVVLEQRAPNKYFARVVSPIMQDLKFSSRAQHDVKKFYAIIVFKIDDNQSLAVISFMNMCPVAMLTSECKPAFVILANICKLTQLH